MKKLLLLFLLCFLFPSQALSAEKIYFGLSDTGEEESFREAEISLQRKVPFTQTFHSWGNSLQRAAPRWGAIRARPILHISTRGEDGEEIITPRAIARGEGDDYLLQLNQEAYLWGKKMIVRPLGEPNRPINLYSPRLTTGKSRGPEYQTKHYRQAFRRIAIILRGGRVDPLLFRLGMKLVGSVLPRPKVEILWSPLPSSLGIRGHEPGRFWPGQKYIDWTGTSLFEEWSVWRDINRFYKKWSPGTKFMIPEWGGVNTEPRFLRRSVSWCKRKKRCLALIYYRGFQDQYQMTASTQAALRRLLYPRLFPLFAPEHRPSDF